MTFSRNSSDTLQSLLEISYLVGSVLEINVILEQVCKISARMMDAQVCSVYLHDDEKEKVVLRASQGLNQDIIGKAFFPSGEGIPGWAALHNQRVALADCRTDPRFRPLEGSGEGAFVAFLCIPLRIQDEVIGVMTARRDHPHEWDTDEITLFETICKLVAIVIEKSRLYYKTVESERLAAIGLSLSEIAHYIKNLLQGINGGQYFVESGLKRGDLQKAQQGWEMLDRNLMKISSLVQNMLNFSRSSAIHFEMENLNGLLYDLARGLESAVMEKGLALRMLLDDTIPEIPMSYDALHEAFLNLLSNAIDAIPEGRAGVVEVRSRLDLSAGGAKITIQDNGIGIPEENLPSIFKLFFSTKGRQGTGIGLSVTKKIIEEHGGSITVRSKPNEGTTFTIHLPPGALEFLSKPRRRARLRNQG